MNALVTLRDAALGPVRTPEDDEDENKSLVAQAVHTALWPLRVATSRPAIKAYITTFLFFLTSFALISVSTTAYFFFYYNFIPQIGLTQTIYLQYDSNAHPYSIIPIDTSALISQQPYDVYVTLHMPRSPSNLAAGNFMLDLALLASPPTTSGPLSFPPNPKIDTAPPIARSRRPAIMPYSGVITSLSHKLLRLPIHLLSLHDLDSAELQVSLFERFAFQRGRTNLPTTAYLEIQSQKLPANCPPPSQSAIDVHILSPPTTTPGTALQIYSAQLNFHARFQGLRYYVYNYRILSFLTFTTLFYIFTLSTTVVVWALISTILSSRNPDPDLSSTTRTKPSDQSPSVKSEEDQGLGIRSIKPEEDSDLDAPAAAAAGLSSTERTFPSLGSRAQPLRYTPSTTTAPSDDAESSWLVQREDQDRTHDAEDEEEDDDDFGADLAGQPDVKDEEADEDEAEDRFRGDSGIGTSMESEAATTAGSGVVRRRSSRDGRGRAAR